MSGDRGLERLRRQGDVDGAQRERQQLARGLVLLRVQEEGELEEGRVVGLQGGGERAAGG